MKPTLIIVGADKGGVGKTTVTRSLLDYFTENNVLARAFDTEHPNGTLSRFHGMNTQVVDITQTADQMRIIEKFTRTGNQILYEVTIEDPEVLVQPWVMPSRTLRLANGNTIIPERGSCTESEHAKVSSQMRH